LLLSLWRPFGWSVAYWRSIDRETYVRQYGQAALGDLPLTAIVFALSLLAVVASLFSLRQKPWVFVVGWLANAPTLVFLIYMAFWFHIF
jgi:hypothetical protein